SIDDCLIEWDFIQNVSSDEIHPTLRASIMAEGKEENEVQDQDLRYVEQLDTASFRLLMETHGQEVWNLAFLITKKRDLADDIAQDVFIKAYRNIDTFRGASSIKTWLLVMTRNTAISYTRSAFLRKVMLVDRIAERGGSPSAEQEALANE